MDSDHALAESPGTEEGFLECRTGQWRVAGLRLLSIPDFLADHNLFAATDVERLKEHAARWCHFLAQLWQGRALDRADNAGFELVYRHNRGAQTLDIFLLARHGSLVSAEAMEQVTGTQGEIDYLIDLAAGGLGTLEIVTQRLSAPELRGILDSVANASHAVEVRQREHFFKRLATSAEDRDLAPVYTVMPWWGAGGAFLEPPRVFQFHGEIDLGLLITIVPTELREEERRELWLRTSDGGMEGESAAARLRSLAQPFLIQVLAVGWQSPGADASKAARAATHLAAVVAAGINEEEPFRPPLWELHALSSQAEVVHLDHHVERALQAAARLEICTDTPTQLRPDALGNDRTVQGNVAELTRLRFLADARCASTAFRLPVANKGGVFGLDIRQRPPDCFVPPRSHGDEENERFLFLGKLHSGGEALLPVKDLTKHALVTGSTGSGKTQTVLAILHQLWNRIPHPTRATGIPFLVLESAKVEYRGLRGVKRWQEKMNLRVYTLGNEACVPFRFNPFEVMPKVRLETHIGRLITAFMAALPSDLPFLPSILGEAIENVYKGCGWMNLLADEGPPLAVPCLFPTMQDLYDELEPVVLKRRYSEDVQRDVLAASRGRVESLLRGSRKAIFSTQRSVPFELIFENPTILEMNDLNEEDKALMALFLLVFLREYREVHRSPDGRLVHVTVIEEAHNLLARGHGSEGESGPSTKAKAVEAISNMLAEIRSYGEGVIIVDQSPCKLAPEAMRNTNLQMAHQLRDGEDREAMARAMIMTEAQQNFLGKLRPGQSALFYTGLERSTFVQMPEFSLLPKGHGWFNGHGFSVPPDEWLRNTLHFVVEESSHMSPFTAAPERWVKAALDTATQETCSSFVQQIRNVDAEFAAAVKAALSPLPKDKERQLLRQRDEKIWSVRKNLAAHGCQAAGFANDPFFAWLFLQIVLQKTGATALSLRGFVQLVNRLDPAFRKNLEALRKA